MTTGWFDSRVKVIKAALGFAVGEDLESGVQGAVEGAIETKLGDKTIQAATEAALAVSAAAPMGAKAITAAGTAEQISTTSVPIKTVWIKPKFNATGQIYIGKAANKTGDAIDTANCVTLIPGSDFEPFDVTDLNELWVDVEVSGNVIEYRTY